MATTLTENQLNYLISELQCWLEYEGIPCVAGLEIDWVEAKTETHSIFHAGYIYEDIKDKEHRGTIEFKAFMSDSVIQDLYFLDDEGHYGYIKDGQKIRSETPLLLNER